MLPAALFLMLSAGTPALTAPAMVDLAGAQVSLPSNPDDQTVFAARELSRYLRLLCGKPSPIVSWRERDPNRTTIALGPQPGFEVTTTTPLDPQAYTLWFNNIGPPGLFINGGSTAGLQYGVYSLLERLGVGFALGGDVLPEPRGQLLVPADLHEVRAPAFRIRGSLPWYNFLNSPTTWDLEDFQYFFDQMAKMKCNFVGFHSYDGEPFAAYPLDNAWHMGAPAATSLTYGWGTIRGMKTPEFGFGTGRFFFGEEFGSRSVTEAAPVGVAEGEAAPAWPTIERRTRDQDAVLRAQCSLAQGLDYARRRGLHVCVGSELTGDPTDPETRRQAEARIRNTLATYPMCDYIWFWQSEGRGGGGEVPAPDTPLRLLCDHYAPVFQYLGDPSRIYEAGRVAAYAQFAHGVVRRVRPDMGVIVSGWGGDAWMRFSDFYVGLDKVLPPDVIFAALDNIDPSSQDHVSAAYGQVSPQRECWPIPWFQSDGGGTRRDQWGPQTNVKPFTALLRDALAKHCAGILAIHWETRGVEEVAAYLAQFAWEPDLSYEAFYERFAGKCFGAQYGPEMAQILMRLESLGPRWTGGPGQVECGGFQWFSDGRRPEPENLQALAEIRARLVQIREACSRGPARAHLERLNYLIATIDWLTNFDHAALLLTPEGEVNQALAAGEAALQAGDQDGARREAQRAVGLLRDCRLREAMEAFPTRLTTQSEWGDLATINIKAYASYEQSLARVKALLGEVPAELTAAAPAEPVLKMRTPPTALPEGTPFAVQAIALGGLTRQVGLLYRRPGETRFRNVLMRPVWGDSYVGDLPAEAIGPEGVEFRLQLTTVGGGHAALPVGPPDAVFSASALPATGPRVYGPYVQGEMAFVPPTQPDTPLLLRGLAVSDAEYDQPATSIAVGPGQPQPATHRAYDLALLPLAGIAGAPTTDASLDATDIMGRTTRGEALPVALIPTEAPGAAGNVRAEVTEPFLVCLQWDPAPGAAEYEVHRSEQAGFQPTEQTLIARWPWTIFFDAEVRPQTTYHYAVVPVADGGVRGTAAPAAPLRIADFPLPPAPANVAGTPGMARVTLTWDAVPQATRGYVVEVERDGAWVAASGQAPVAQTTLSVGGLLNGQEQRFRVRGVDRARRLGEPSAAVAVTPVEPPHEPVFATSFTSLTAETGQAGTLHDKAALRDGCLDVREGGWIAFPNQDALQLNGAVTVEFWTNIDRIEGIPVLFDFGHFLGRGYWLQLFGNGIRWCISYQRILDTAPLPLGQWHHLAATYDGLTSRVYVDGVQVGQREVGPADLTPWPGELRVGQYADLGPQFQTIGRLDDVKVYQRPLSAEEVRAAVQAGRSAP